MNITSLTLRIALATAAALPTLATQAQTAAPIVGTRIDPNTFIVGHPASPRWVAPTVRHANGEHPAVLQAARAGQAQINANTFLVQPPASTTWVVKAPTPTLVLAEVR